MEAASHRTILVVDDEPKIVDAVQSYLEHAGYRVLRAGDGREALAQFDSQRPDLVVLDLMLPDIGGEEVCRTLRQHSQVPVIMLTARAEEKSILRGLELGADDYVTKPFSPRQLVARVAAVLRRAPRSAGCGLMIDHERHEVLYEGRPLGLTPNEFRILAALAGHPAKTFTREELIRSALGEEYDGYDRVIDTHIKNIRQKLGDDPRNPRHVLTVHGIGYRFGGGA